MADEVGITWLGHGTFLLESQGKRVLIDPWTEGNPAFPAEWKERLRSNLDAILISHGHFDHVGGMVEIAQATKAPVLSIFDMTGWLQGQGIPEAQCMGFNKGGTVEVAGMEVTMVPAQHSSSHAGEGGQIIALGEPVGYILECQGATIYHTGDTCVFGDMALWADMYRPDAVIMPIGGFFTMGPRQAAYAAKLIGAPIVIPGHFGTFPALRGTPEELRQELATPTITVVELQPGESTRVSKQSGQRPSLGFQARNSAGR